MNTRNTFRKIVHTAGTILVGILAGILFAIICAAASIGLKDAKADTPDDTYVSEMRDILNNPTADRDVIINGGHAICAKIAFSGEHATASYLEAPPHPWSFEQAWRAIGSTERAYCIYLDEDGSSSLSRA